METIDEILEKMEEILDDSAGVPFSNKAMVNKKEFFNLIMDVRLKLPNEIKQSKWVVEERNKILIEAQEEAEYKVKEAESEKFQMINEHEITKMAYEQSEEIIENAKKVSREIRLGAREYADEVLEKLEKQIRTTIEISHTNFVQLEKYILNEMESINENRKELNVKNVNNVENNESEQE